MTSKKTPLFVLRQPLLADSPSLPLSFRQQPSKRRAWLAVALSTACMAVLGAATVTASSVIAPGDTTVLPSEKSTTTAAPDIHPEEISRLNALTKAHEDYNQAVETRRQELSRRIVEHYKVSPVAARKIVDAAHEAGARYNVDPLMLLSISAVESSFNPQARSSAGAIGLTQLLPRAHPEKLARIRAAGKSPFDVKTSLELGAEVFSEYHARFRGDKIKALQQYNGSLKDSSRRYSNKVMAAHVLLSQGLAPLPAKPSEPLNTAAMAEVAKCVANGTERC